MAGRQQKRTRWRREPEFRPRRLSKLERAIVWRLLTAVEFPQAEYFRAQIAETWVHGACDCGCGTIDLAVDEWKADRAPSPAWDEPALLTEAASPWLTLSQCDGVLISLEHLCPDEDRERRLELAPENVPRLAVELRLDDALLAAIE